MMKLKQYFGPQDESVQDILVCESYNVVSVVAT
jgi:hypothetical protein